MNGLICLLMALFLLPGAVARTGGENDIGMAMDQLAREVNASGWESAFGGEVEVFGETATLFLLDEEGAIVERTGNSFLRNRTHAAFLISRYRHDYGVNGEELSCGVALLVNEHGDALSAFRAIYTPEPLGEKNASYSFYFPDIGEKAYARGQWYYDDLGGLTGDLWFYLEEEIVLSKIERLKVVDYINWERDLLELNPCPNLVYRPLENGGALVLIVGTEG